MRFRHLTSLSVLALTLSGCIAIEETQGDASTSDLVFAADNTLLLAGGEGVLRFTDFRAVDPVPEEIRTGLQGAKILPARDGGYLLLGKRCPEPDPDDLRLGEFLPCGLELWKTDAEFHPISRAYLSSVNADFPIDLYETPEGDVFVLRGETIVEYNEDGSIYDLCAGPDTLLRVRFSSGGFAGSRVVSDFAGGAWGRWTFLPDGSDGAWVVGVADTAPSCYQCYYLEDYFALHLDGDGRPTEEVQFSTGRTIRSASAIPTGDGKVAVVTSSEDEENHLAFFDPAARTFEDIAVDAAGIVMDTAMSDQGEIVGLFRESLQFEKEATVYTLHAFDMQGVKQWSAPMAASLDCIEFFSNEEDYAGLGYMTLTKIAQASEDVWTAAGGLSASRVDRDGYPWRTAGEHAICLATVNRRYEQHGVRVFRNHLGRYESARIYLGEILLANWDSLCDLSWDAVTR